MNSQAGKVRVRVPTHVKTVTKNRRCGMESCQTESDSTYLVWMGPQKQTKRSSVTLMYIIFWLA